MKKIFVSYSWDSKEHKIQVLSFVAFLRDNGFNVTLDEEIMQTETSAHLNKMMVSNIQFSDKIIIILTQGYKNKADSDTGGVGTEYGYILNEITDREDKYILVSFQSLSSSVIDEIVPFGLKGREIVDLKDDEKNEFRKLFSKLTNQRLFSLPPVAEKETVIIEEEIPKFTLNNHEEKNQYDYYDMYFFDTPTKFFDYRLSQAFPGVRGIKWFNNSQKVIKRLEILLRVPLDLEKKNNPIWWFRGYQCLQIEKCKFLSEEKFIMGNIECLVDRICVYRSSRYDRSFVYVELKAEESVGAYQHDENYITRMIKNLGYADEEYGIYKEHLITKEEFDDGAIFINNELINFESRDIELRVRFLSKYNFIICAIFNPINSNDADEFFEDHLNGMLNNKRSIEQMVDFVEKLPRNKNAFKDI